jgi:hypothetical protein
LLFVLLQKPPTFRDDQFIVLLRNGTFYPVFGRVAALAALRFEGHAPDSAMSAAIRYCAKTGRTNEPDTKRASRLLLGLISDVPFAALVKDEWADIVRSNLADEDDPSLWSDLFVHCSAAYSKARPNDRWRRQVKPLLNALGAERVGQATVSWLDQTDLRPPSRNARGGVNDDAPVSQLNRDILKGLIWASVSAEVPESPRAMRDFARRAYAKHADHGAASTALGNAAVWALGQFSEARGVPYLSDLRSHVRYAAARRSIAAALEAAAEATGQTRQDVEEVAIPDFGFAPDGTLFVAVGDGGMELKLGTKLETTWRHPSGKSQKSVPKLLRENCAVEVRDAKKLAKEVEKVRAAQRDRIERLWLDNRRLSVGELRTRYFLHPLVATVASRLLWHIETETDVIAAVWRNDGLVGLGDAPLDVPDDAIATLWHPLQATETNSILVWRDWFGDQGITQPFQQLWRPVYRPTRANSEAEERFKGQIIRQHIFASLCQQRAWRYALQGNFDSYNVPLRPLDHFGLVAEFDADPIDTDDHYMYAYLRVGTLRFRGEDNRLVPLEEVPSVVFSEMMRELDLFVSAAGVANDPNLPSKLQSQTNHELTPMATSRRDVLAAVLPRMRSKAKLSLQSDHLKVEGEHGSYLVHLGSGRVSRVGDQSAIVVTPSRAAKAAVGRIFLPFEGDGQLVGILSKAVELGRAGGSPPT